MIKNDENKKVTGSDINNNSNELSSSTRPTSFQKVKFRKDAKGNLILKKKMQIKKTKHHIYFIDKINPKKPLVTTIEIESYKKYNLEGEEEVEEEIKKASQTKLKPKKRKTPRKTPKKSSKVTKKMPKKTKKSNLQKRNLIIILQKKSFY